MTHEILPLLFTLLAALLVGAISWGYFRAKPPRNDSVSIDFDNYKWREESQRQFGAWR